VPSTPASWSARERKSVSFGAAPERLSPRAGPADLAGQLVQVLPSEQESDGDVSVGSAAGARTWLETLAVLPGAGIPDTIMAPVMSGEADGPTCAQEEDAEWAEIEAYADEQARRFMPLTDRRRARRTATISIGRAKQVDGITFQMKTSALWQRRGATGCSLAAPSRAHGSVLGAAM